MEGTSKANAFYFQFADGPWADAPKWFAQMAKVMGVGGCAATFEGKYLPSSCLRPKSLVRKVGEFAASGSITGLRAHIPLPMPLQDKNPLPGAGQLNRTILHGFFGVKSLAGGVAPSSLEGSEPACSIAAAGWETPHGVRAPPQKAETLDSAAMQGNPRLITLEGSSPALAFHAGLSVSMTATTAPESRTSCVLHADEAYGQTHLRKHAREFGGGFAPRARGSFKRRWTRGTRSPGQTSSTGPFRFLYVKRVSFKSCTRGAGVGRARGRQRWSTQ